jgi:ankyrin repeat protein
VALVEYLLPLIDPILIDKKTTKEETALMRAAMNGFVEMGALLLNNGASVQSTNTEVRSS